jgi:predicted alpha-1,2-mannosidase
MINKRGVAVAIVLFFSTIAFTQKEDLVKYVNPLMGTQSRPDLSNGNTYPAICTPWAMNMWTPQTGENGNGWQYTYTADKIRGFKQTHQPSPWMNDYGVFSIMPVSGKAVFKPGERASWFSHKSEIARADYYSVYLADYHLTTEITPTERAAIFRITYHSKDSAFIVVDAFPKGSYIKIIPEENKIIGYSNFYARGKLKNFASYFVIQFNTPFNYTRVWQKDAYADGLENKGEQAGAIVGFKITQPNQQVIAKVASSFISHEQALLNLKNEVGNKSFDEVRNSTNKTWNEVLSKITIEGATEEQKSTFYSCFYRAALFPNKLYEKDAAGKIVHYSPYNGKVMPGYMYGGTGFWDTFRALYPFLNLFFPAINTEMQEGLVNDYKEGGFLPEWSSPGYADIMIGNNSASVVADAYLKNVKIKDITTLYEALLHGANNEGPVSAVGRFGVKYYNTLGYVPYNVKINESVARTLEYAYDDFTIFKLAQKLNKPAAEIEQYAQRCLNYRNVFDPEYHLMRGKNLDGSFQSPFNPLKWGDAFTEGNSWHYTWSVFHDIDNLARLMGGKKQFATMLDSVFSLPPLFDNTYYGGTIHEIREMQIANMGQYAHGNQPIQHMIYLYNYAGESYKTQYWVREALNRLYKPTPDGYCGDEDNGQTSAWYVFSAIGFYPVCPGTDQYILGAPLFKKITLHLDGGKKFIINAPGNSAQNRFISSQSLNNRSYTKTWLSYPDITKGGSFTATMSNLPNKSRMTTDADLPYSFSKDEKSIYDKVKDIKPAGLTELTSLINKTDTITRNDLTLYFMDEDQLFTDEYKKRFVDAYFKQYPKLAAKYNAGSPRAVKFIIDKNYDGVAATYDGNTIVYNPAWFEKNPEDLDVITHELMHVVQNYGGNNVPGWVTEGVADYVRATEGINNVNGKWTMPDLAPKHNYYDAYRITARFLVWITQHYQKDFVVKLNEAARTKKYTTDFWKDTTGKTVEELWKEYVANPAIEIVYL